MNKHYPFHTSVLDNYYGCDPYNTVDAQRLRRHIRTVAGFLSPTVDIPWAAMYAAQVKPDTYRGIIEAMLGIRSAK